MPPTPSTQASMTRPSHPSSTLATPFKFARPSLQSPPHLPRRAEPPAQSLPPLASLSQHIGSFRVSFSLFLSPLPAPSNQEYHANLPHFHCTHPLTTPRAIQRVLPSMQQGCWSAQSFDWLCTPASTTWHPPPRHSSFPL
jgi:hypothetical protein